MFSSIKMLEDGRLLLFWLLTSLRAFSLQCKTCAFSPRSVERLRTWLNEENKKKGKTSLHYFSQHACLFIVNSISEFAADSYRRLKAKRRNTLCSLNLKHVCRNRFQYFCETHFIQGYIVGLNIIVYVTFSFGIIEKIFPLFNSRPIMITYSLNYNITALCEHTVFPNI